MTKNVLCITLNPAIDMTVSLDVLTLGVVNRATSSQTNAAGKALNGAQVLVDLGFGATATGFLGADNDGIFKKLFAVHEALNHQGQSGLLMDEFERVAGVTRTNIKLVDDSSGKSRTTDVNGRGFLVDETDKLHFFERVSKLAKNTDAVLVAGSLPQGFDLADFEHLLVLLTGVCDKVAVDVSGEALKVAIKHKLWLIKPNSDELFEAFGVRADDFGLQVALFDEFGCDIEHIFVSMGSQGVHWIRGNKEREFYHAIPPVMKVKSTVGAGDTFVAGMIFGLLQEEAPEVVLARATALSAHVVSIVGVGIPDGERLASLSEQVQIQKVTIL